MSAANSLHQIGKYGCLLPQAIVARSINYLQIKCFKYIFERIFKLNHHIFTIST